MLAVPTSPRNAKIAQIFAGISKETLCHTNTGMVIRMKNPDRKATIWLTDTRPARSFNSRDVSEAANAERSAQMSPLCLTMVEQVREHMRFWVPSSMSSVSAPRRFREDCSNGSAVGICSSSGPLPVEHWPSMSAFSLTSMVVMNVS